MPVLSLSHSGALGSLYAMARAMELTEEQASLLTEADRERVDAKIFLAQISAAKGDLEQARINLEEALLKEPANMQALGLLASISAATDLSGALELLDEGIAIADDDRPLRLLRIQLLQRAGTYQDEVVEEYQGLMTDYPDEVAFGYRIKEHAFDHTKYYGVVVNPKKSDLIKFSSNDKIIVLAED